MDAGDLAERFGPLVRKLAARVRPRASVLDADDLCQEGFAVLPRAAASFDPTRGVALVTWLTFRVRGAMLDALRGADHLTRGQRARVAAGLEPPVRVGSLDAPADPHDPDSGPVLDLLADGREPGPAAGVDARDLAEWLGRGLDGRRAEFFRLHFLGGVNQAEASAAVGVSPSSGSLYHHDILEHCRLRAAHLNRRDEPMAEKNGAHAASVLRSLLRGDGATLTYEQVLMHLGEDGHSCTRQEYEAEWESLHGGEDVMGRRRRPPGAAAASAPAAQPPRQPEPARPEERNGTMSESNGAHGAPRSNIEKSRCLQALVREMGAEARHRDIKARAAELGLPASDAAVNRAQNAVFPDRPKRQGGPGLTKQAPRPAPRPAASAPAPAAGEDLLTSVLDARRRLGALKQQVEAAGGQLRYTFEFTLRGEG